MKSTQKNNSVFLPEWVFCSLFVFWFSFDSVVQFSSAWHSQNHPTIGAQVRLKSGEVLTGDLHRDWDGDWVLTQQRGSDRHFSDQSIISIAATKSIEPVGFDQMWRSWLPVVAFCALCSVFPVVAVLSLFSRQRHLNPI